MFDRRGLMAIGRGRSPDACRTGVPRVITQVATATVAQRRVVLVATVRMGIGVPTLETLIVLVATGRMGMGVRTLVETLIVLVGSGRMRMGVRTRAMPGYPVVVPLRLTAPRARVRCPTADRAEPMPAAPRATVHPVAVRDRGVPELEQERGVPSEADLAAAKRHLSAREARVL